MWISLYTSWTSSLPSPQALLQGHLRHHILAKSEILIPRCSRPSCEKQPQILRKVLCNWFTCLNKYYSINYIWILYCMKLFFQRHFGECTDVQDRTISKTAWDFWHKRGKWSGIRLWGVSREDRINPGRNGRNSEPTCLLNFNKW